MRAFLCLAYAFAAGISSAAESPSQAAILFAEAWRDGKTPSELSVISALHADTGEQKKQKIFALWRSESPHLLNQPFEVAEQQIREKQAAVILTQFDQESGHRFHLLSLACVQVHGQWRAAPIPGSFENSLISYEKTILQDRQDLETWMMERETSMRQDWHKRIRENRIKQMKESITPEALQSIQAHTLIEELLLAIRQRNHAAILARIGGFSQNSVADWKRMEEHVERVFSSDRWQQWPWRLLSSKKSLMTFSEVLDLGEEKSMDALILHPDSLYEEPECLHFSVQCDDQGIARVVLPEAFWVAHPSEEELAETMDCDLPDQRKLYAQLRQQARQLLPDDALKEPENIASVIEKSLQQLDFARFWATGCPPAETDSLMEMPEVIGLWQKIHGASQGAQLLGLVGLQVHENHALLALQSYSPRQKNPFTLHKVWLEKRGQEWSLCADSPEPRPQPLTDWWNDSKKSWTQSIADSLTQQITRIGGLAAQSPDPTKVREVFEAWDHARKEQNLSALLPYSTAFLDERSIQSMMQSLAQNLSSPVGHHELLHVAAHGRWAGVSTKHLREPFQSVPHYPMYVFVMTDNGPRILPQIDIKLSANNHPYPDHIHQFALGDLKKFLPDAAIQELQQLYEQHRSLVEKRAFSAP